MKHYTHKLSQISEEILGSEVQIAGWLHNRRDHGGVLFLDARAFGDEDGIDEVVRAKAMFANQAAAEVVGPETTQAGGWELTSREHGQALP